MKTVQLLDMTGFWQSILSCQMLTSRVLMNSGTVRVLGAGYRCR